MHIYCRTGSTKPNTIYNRILDVVKHRVPCYVLYMCFSLNSGISRMISALRETRNPLCKHGLLCALNL